jgi:DNA helicase-2/ATP-dependent DNA helicase PcrA
LTGTGILKNLNDSQREAVVTVDGPLLVIAGPGTGKTLTITHRIAYLISQGVCPENILCVTFTNRAAREMLERTESLLGKSSVRPFIGTFHSLGVRILGETVTHDFVVYSRDDQLELIKTILTDSGLAGHSSKRGRTNYQKIVEAISKIKNLTDIKDEWLKSVFERYQSALSKNSALDFDDLIIRPVELLNDRDLLERYRMQFRYIIVDEYQDINPAQYRLMSLLTGEKGNICAVGDPDQAIYAFRGADVENFLNFERDFSGAGRIVLTKNYRSTAMVLNASHSLIRRNRKRIPKDIRAVRGEGSRITVISVPDERAEGEVIVEEIEKRIGGTSHYRLIHTEGTAASRERSYGFSDFAVIFRTNGQARGIREAFARSGIPCRVIGTTDQLKRGEISDVLSLLRLLLNPEDDLSLREVITSPYLGFGETVLSALLTIAEEKGLSLFDAAKMLSANGDERVRKFVSLIERFMELKEMLPMDKLLDHLLSESGIRDYYRDSGDNLMFLETLVSSYRDLRSTEALPRFANELTICSVQADAFDSGAEAVALMTMHMAKGLEFSVVFIAGVEDGLIPCTIKRDDVEIEEERRLFYVGMTRARDELFLIHARKRLLYGRKVLQSPSPFLKEIPDEFIEKRTVPDRRGRKQEERQAGLF